ncbi:MAG: tetratricopeptide repeat protein [Galactobacillus timonensis]|uniref:tetratricopeptide repeat protein n=1 Tax=Galactobacillus timonensis TaxID=2041840 RepID=UPI002409970B|nr:tetratricopeptide repeat protein [Galactobacillus timonensis]MDD6599889.1 tetratricopeptide repeat protein [Galactobacillus timonensis]
MDNNEEVKQNEDETLTAIGEAFYRGIGVKVDYKEAFQYFQKAASMGNVRAKTCLGRCYELGRGTKRSYETALDCYEDASAQGNILATLKIGDFYQKGIDSLVPKNSITASQYYLQALNLLQMSPDAWEAADVYLRVGDCLFNGIGVARDIKTAYKCYSLAADGFFDRMNNAGDAECAKDLDRAEKGEKRCSKLLHLPKPVDDPPFDA